MKILSLGLSGGVADEIKLKIAQSSCQELVQEGLRVAVEEKKRGCYDFLEWNITEGELSFRNYEKLKSILKNEISQLLADSIVTWEEKKLLRRIINHNYRYFQEDEQEIIFDQALKVVNNNDLMGKFSLPYRRKEVLDKLLEYFEQHHELVIEGFVIFRLKDYYEKLTGIVDKAVDEYMMDLEYKEFIKVLRYFVDVQETHMDEVHVIISDRESFRIRDSRGKAISNPYLETLMVKNTDEINYEDLLISALITIAPRHIVLHCGIEGKNSDVVGTIERVFEDRVIVCRGCDLCQSDSLGQFTP